MIRKRKNKIMNYFWFKPICLSGKKKLAVYNTINCVLTVTTKRRDISREKNSLCFRPKSNGRPSVTIGQRQTRSWKKKKNCVQHFSVFFFFEQLIFDLMADPRTHDIFVFRFKKFFMKRNILRILKRKNHFPKTTRIYVYR